MINTKMEIMHKNMKYVYHTLCFRIIKMLGYPLISWRDIFYPKIGFMHKNGGNSRQGSQKINQKMSKCHIKKTGMEMLLPVINLRKPFRNHLAIFFAPPLPLRICFCKKSRQFREYTSSPLPPFTEKIRQIVFEGLPES